MQSHKAVLVLFTSVLALFLANTTSAQLEGHFSLEKNQFKVGEPIYLRFDFTNAGKIAIQYNSGSRYSYCGGYTITVTNGPPLQHPSCDRGFLVSCIGSKEVLEPGETRQESILLNYEHDLSKPGSYEISATWGAKYGPKTEVFSIPAGDQEIKVEGRFQIELEDASGENLEPLFHPYVASLSAKDEESRMEAARAIGSIAPPFLEATMVAMLDIPAARPFALIGLKKVNTPHSREVLASIVQGASGDFYEKEQIIKYLSEMGDKKYFPLLLDIAQKQLPNQARDYVLATSRLGGEDAVPFLKSLLADSDGFSRANGVMGLGETGSRSAVPLLIETLKDPNPDFGGLALRGLRQLTHRSAFLDGQVYRVPAAEQYAGWSRWWLLHGNSAPVYSSSECGEVLPLT